MTSPQPTPSTAADVYRGFLDALNRQDLAAAELFLDVERYRENCVGFTPGFVGSYEGSFFDYDASTKAGSSSGSNRRTCSQMRQRYGKPLELAGLGALMWRL